MPDVGTGQETWRGCSQARRSAGPVLAGIPTTACLAVPHQEGLVSAKSGPPLGSFQAKQCVNGGIDTQTVGNAGCGEGSQNTSNSTACIEGYGPADL